MSTHQLSPTELNTELAPSFAKRSDIHHDSGEVDMAENPEPDLTTTTEYYSVQSTTAETIISQTDSTGLQTYVGATWGQAMTATANSGFASGTPRPDGWKGVREGREKELGLRGMKGVGRTGKRAVPVSDGLIQAAMEQAHEDARYHPRAAVEAENRLLSYVGSVFDLHAYDIPDDIQVGDFKKASKEEFHSELKRRRMESNDDRWMNRQINPSPPLEEAEVKKILRLQENSNSLPHFIAPPSPRPVMDPATAPRFLKKLY